MTKTLQINTLLLWKATWMFLMRQRHFPGHLEITLLDNGLKEKASMPETDSHTHGRDIPNSNMGTTKCPCTCEGVKTWKWHTAGNSSAIITFSYKTRNSNGFLQLLNRVYILIAVTCGWLHCLVIALFHCSEDHVDSVSALLKVWVEQGFSIKWTF